VIGASNKMTLAAGRSLTIHPGFNSHSGAVFVAYTSQDLNCDHTNVNARTEDLQTLIAPSVISPEPELLAPPTYGLEIFPNPNLGQFKVVPHLKNAEAIQNILIRDASGKLLKSYTGMPFEGSFDIQELENWNFVIMEIVTNQGKYTEKIMRDYRLGDERNRSIKK
ncbi:MAG TPA: T9SS type A sorting domain-containing protein, partial [Cytophagales bacterium]|nr:T9SS type A sorting domain-containing protein [Cytophagales bacterium]